LFQDLDKGILSIFKKYMTWEYLMRVDINPELLQWACERAGLSTQIVAMKVPQLLSWEKGEKKPTLKQIERFASIVHMPIGFLFLESAPVEEIPIPDFRTIENKRIGHPSPDLLETIYLCQQRQEWYHDFSRSFRESPCPFVGSVTLDDDIKEVADKIRLTLKFDIIARRQLATWEETLRQFITQAEDIGILVMVSGVVGNNNRRRLDYEEFRGFALSDELAPLIFINGADTKSAQMFTLAHELAHIWLGKTALSDIGLDKSPSNEIENWCNLVAAEMLVPEEIICNEYNSHIDLSDQMIQLARFFKVSTLVILRRIYDLGYLSLEDFRKAYHDELVRLLALKKGSGGDFYLTQGSRISKRFARALIISTMEGQTLHRDAFQLLGFSKLATFRELGSRLGVI
jgi:Zn-dependent peptidase ImmA (M78 family)